MTTEMDTVLNVMVIDDEHDALVRMEYLLGNTDVPMTVTCHINPEFAVKQALESAPDLLFVDVEMPVMSGFDVVKALHAAGINSTVIFVTAYSQYAIKAIRNAAFDYLLKPVDIDELKVSLQRYMNGNSGNNVTANAPALPGGKLRFPTRAGFIYLHPDDILYCTADGSYTVLHMADSSIHTLSQNLRKVQEELSKYSFYRISRFTLINTTYLHLLDRKARAITLKYDDELHTLSASSRYLRGLME